MAKIKLKAGKKRINITVTAEIFDRVQAELSAQDYPHGYLSYYLDKCISDLDDHLTGAPSDLTALQQLMIDEHLMRKEKRQ